MIQHLGCALLQETKQASFYPPLSRAKWENCPGNGMKERDVTDRESEPSRPPILCCALMARDDPFSCNWTQKPSGYPKKISYLLWQFNNWSGGWFSDSVTGRDQWRAEPEMILLIVSTWANLLRQIYNHNINIDDSSKLVCLGFTPQTRIHPLMPLRHLLCCHFPLSVAISVYPILTSHLKLWHLTAGVTMGFQTQMSFAQTKRPHLDFRRETSVKVPVREEIVKTAVVFSLQCCLGGREILFCLVTRLTRASSCSPAQMWT